eukprot:272752-Chlamydomonas_euryale.AAC.1
MSGMALRAGFKCSEMPRHPHGVSSPPACAPFPLPCPVLCVDVCGPSRRVPLSRPSCWRRLSSRPRAFALPRP